MTIAYIGLSSCFYLNALSFVAVLVALSKIKARGEPSSKSHSMKKDFIEGIQYVRNSSEIFRLILLIAVFSLVGIPFINLLPVFAAEILHAGPEGFGFLVGATGIGALTAALSLALKGDIQDKSRFMALSALCFSFSLLAFSLSKNYYLSIFFLAFIGWGLVSFLATANSFIQLSTPDNLRGRAMSVFTFVFLGTAPIGNSILGVFADIIGTAVAVSIASVFCIFVSVSFCMKICRS
jgi:predicted MFS family arabinose efflux permease